jgi:hypothetical protein
MECAFDTENVDKPPRPSKIPVSIFESFHVVLRP